jgi:hypothetical protein
MDSLSKHMNSSWIALDSFFFVSFRIGALQLMSFWLDESQLTKLLQYSAYMIALSCVPTA